MTSPAAQSVSTFCVPPSEATYRIAEDASERVRHRPAPLRRRFARSAEDRVPPLAKLLRGGEIRLKLYLSVLWIAVKPPHSTNFPAAAWAELIGLPDAFGKGARKINDAMRWLEANQFIRVERSAGQPSLVYLLDDAGRGSDYQPPYVNRDPYFKLPHTFWTKQWVSALSGRAVAMLLILMDQRDIDDPSEPLWVSPQRARDMYALSADTWSRGTAELAAQELIEVGRRAVNANAFGWRRQRNVYTVDEARLAEAPHWVEDQQG